MSMKYRFANTLYADTPQGTKRFVAGDVIDEGDILAGCLASCLGTGALVEYTPPPVEAVKPPAPAPTPTQAPEPKQTEKPKARR